MNTSFTNNIKGYKIFIPTLPHLIDKLTNLTKNWKIETIISTNNEKMKNYIKMFLLVLLVLELHHWKFLKE